MRLLFLLLSSLLVTFAQQDMGYITGSVTDPSTAAVPGAVLTITQPSTGLRYTAASNQAGNYSAGPLRVGTYEVSISKEGFKSQVIAQLQVHAQDRVRLDFSLAVGDTTQRVEVTAEAQLLERQSAALGLAVDEQSIRQLPLNARNFQQLAVLAAGTSTAIRNKDQAGGYYSHGQHTGQNNFILDGVDNNSYVMGLQDNKAQVVIPSLDAIQEFKIETSNFSAEFGANAGSVMNVSIKSGTNNIHGTAYEYLRNDKFDARPTFSYLDRTGDGRADPEILRQNQFGATLGGPLRRNKTFWFASWEGLRIRHSQSFLATVPTAQERQGIFDPRVGVVRDPVSNVNFPGNAVPKSRWDSVAAGLVDLWPAANFNGSGTRANYVSGPPWTETKDQVDARFDHSFSDRDKVFVRYSFNRYLNARFSPLPLPARGSAGNNNGYDDNHGNSVAASWTHILNPSLVNEARFGMPILEAHNRQLSTESLAEKYGIKGIQLFDPVKGLPQMTFNGGVNYDTLGETTGAPNWKVSQSQQFLDNITWTRGRHMLKAGADIRLSGSRIIGASNAVGVFNFNGKFTGVSLADFLVGWANTFAQGTIQSGDQIFRNYMFYVSDEWKVTQKLTLTLGLRYELNSPWFDKNNRMTQLELAPGPNYGNLLPVAADARSWSERALVNTDTNNWAPRIGFAYRPSERWVVRAAGGVFYGGQENLGANARAFQNWPYQIAKTLPSTRTTPALILAQGVPANFLDPGKTLPANSSMQIWDRHFPLPTVYQWNVSLQRQFNANTVLKAAYVGSSSSYIRGQINFNSALPGDPQTEIARRPFPSLAALRLTTPYGHHSYEGLDLQLERRFSAGFSVVSSYTWGHSIDNVKDQQGPESNTLQNRSNWAADRGNSGYDIRHNFTVGYVWEVPYGRGKRWNGGPMLNAVAGNWQISGFVLVASGLPYTPTYPNGADALGTSGIDQWRPNRIASGTVANPTPDNWFDRTAFVRPCVGTVCTFGNSGRNILFSGGRRNFDFGVSKYFRITEWLRTQVRAEGFNMFNTPAYDVPTSNLGSVDAGKVRSTYSVPRQLQFALRLEF